MIFSAEDLMESSPNLPRVRPHTSGGAQGPPMPGGPAHELVAKVVLLDDARTDEPQLIGDQFVIGRTGDLRLGDARVSRRHALIKRHGASSYLVEDLKSSNGTYLNGTKIDQPCELQSGDVIRVGPFEIRFLLEQEIVVHHIAPVPVPAQQAPIDALPATSQKALSTSKPAAKPSPAVAQPRTGDGARVSLSMGSEHLTLPVGASLKLMHSLCIGEMDLEAESAVLIRKPDGFWLEPTPGREAVLHNGRKITTAVQIVSGDRVQVGPLEMEFLGED